ncbi:MAG: hypothetical protein WKF81_07655 [Thermomicrobiales bacterium]
MTEPSANASRRSIPLDLPDLPVDSEPHPATADPDVETVRLYRRSRQRQVIEAGRLADQRRTPRPQRKDFSFVVPQPRQMLSQTMPDLLVFVTALVVLAIGPLEPLGVPVWTMALLIPSLLIFLLSSPETRPLWRRTTIVNLLVLGVLFPALVVRQSVVDIPYLDRSTGTLWPPLLATVGVAVVLIGLALASAVLANEDPEYAGVLYLPAAMLVPILAGPVDVTDFRTSVFGIALIYLVVAGLTVVASVLPGAFPTLVAPVAIAVEFMALTAYRNESIFPIGAGTTSKVLFYGIVFVAVSLAIAVPTMSLWVRETRRLMHSSPDIGPI